MKHKKKNRFGRFLLYLLIVIILATGAFAIWFYFDTQIKPPDIRDMSALKLQRDSIGPGYYTIGNNWLRKNKYGLWEMYLEGSPFEMGVVNGKLTKELIYQQEKAFVEQINIMVPSPTYLKFLKYFIAFFNRDIDEYILPEYKQEIYGISFSASHEFDYIGSNYERMLNYHAAHDIGHALQDLMLVGCTSFAANLGYSDSSLIIGRNFDFYVNDDFAKNKIIVFVNPKKGNKFAYITWASMIGVVSGMNDKGLTVTLNAGKSDIPFKAATPISLLAREILQYAGNIDQAVAIAKKRKIFVAESLLIGSAADNTAVIIEKSPTKMDVYKADNHYLVCANHFQGQTFMQDENNIERIKEAYSIDREERADELLASKDTTDYLMAAKILRDRKGLKGESIGIGNEKAMAQMISHHSVIFEPLRQWMWVSTYPYQLGRYLAYNLTSVFNHPQATLHSGLFDSTLTIPEDPFFHSGTFKKYLKYKVQRKQLQQFISSGIKLKNETAYIRNFIQLNPDRYQGYVLAGDYYAGQGNKEKALKFYRFSLTKDIDKTSQRKKIEDKIGKLKDH